MVRLSIVGRTYLERGQPVLVLVQWGPGGGPRNILIRRADGSRVVRPFRGLRVIHLWRRGRPFPKTEEWDDMVACGSCGCLPNAAGHDPCISDLPDVWVACCGHACGEGAGLDACYVGFRDGLMLYGNAARAAMEMLGGAPPPAAPGATSGMPPVVSRFASDYRWPVLERPDWHPLPMDPSDPHFWDVHEPTRAAVAAAFAE